ncbi:MAG: AAA family ATPase [Lachnospiraceae bacterium]|jgi:AAA+ ATPase superfamily predicted ATPase|nr:AAA family ATPase [Lachnospiraceae bacterium]
MILGRTQELKELNTFYQRDGSQIIVLYGESGIGKSAVIADFLGSKPFFLFQARPASEREQLFHWGRERNSSLESSKLPKLLPEYPGYSDIFATFTTKGKQKTVLVVDEFHLIVKNSPDFMPQLIDFVHDKWKRGEVLVILVSSQPNWIENNMITKIGEQAYEISAFMKIKEMTFSALSLAFPDFAARERVEAYAILGGNPSLWRHFGEKLSTKQNICGNILSAQGYLYRYGEEFVAEQLRETGIYSTLLAAIAEGRNRLSELHTHTGFSRAKIIVYLKNLIGLGIIEKLPSAEATSGVAASGEVKGKSSYRISHHFVHFYFTYLYPNMSDWQRLEAAAFYDVHIIPTFKSYVADYYRKACADRLAEWNLAGKLPLALEPMDEWRGKIRATSVTAIDIIARGRNRVKGEKKKKIALEADDTGGGLVYDKTLAALCNWEKPLMTYDDYEWLLFAIEKAKMTVDYIYLFSIGHFDERLTIEAKVKKNIYLVKWE